MGVLVRLDPEPFIADLASLGLLDGRPIPEGFAIYHHADSRHDKGLTVIHNIDVYDLHQAHAHHFGIRRWRHVSVGVRGSLQARLADQKRIGRARRGGERSPAPLPDWYDLTHIAYDHHAELGFNPGTPVFQLLPPPGVDYLNLAEALHLRQPL